MVKDPKAIAAYRQGYERRLGEEWFSAVAAYDEATRLQPGVAGLYEARGTAHMYGGDHDQALADYSRAIELDPHDASLWRRRSHAYMIAPRRSPNRELRMLPAP